jgi:hypothetical protein
MVWDGSELTMSDAPRRRAGRRFDESDIGRLLKPGGRQVAGGARLQVGKRLGVEGRPLLLPEAGDLAR